MPNFGFNTKTKRQKSLEGFLFKLNAAESHKSGRSYYLLGKVKLILFFVSTVRANFCYDNTCQGNVTCGLYCNKGTTVHALQLWPPSTPWLPPPFRHMLSFPQQDTMKWAAWLEKVSQSWWGYLWDSWSGLEAHSASLNGTHRELHQAKAPIQWGTKPALATCEDSGRHTYPLPKLGPARSSACRRQDGSDLPRDLNV